MFFCKETKTKRNDMATDTITDNELIAEFHGWSKRKVGKGTGEWLYDFGAWSRSNFSADSLKYDQSWDWLMPVVSKISEYRLAHPDETAKVCNLKIVVSHWALYERVVEFIKWYNQQTKTI